MTEEQEQDYSIVTQNLSYSFPNRNQIALHDINLAIKPKSRVLIVGPNGAGKSTLLKILAGQKLIKKGKILINGVDPFAFNKPPVAAVADGTNKAKVKSIGVVTYLGTEWANNEITKRDIPFSVLMKSIGGDLYPERRDLLVELLDIDIEWRMNQISDGERRRVQLAMGLLKPFDLLLLDEVTVDLDVLVRNELLSFLKKETEIRESTVIYATHIFDGLGSMSLGLGAGNTNWPTRLIHLTGGEKCQDLEIDQIKYDNSVSSVTIEKENEKDNDQDQYKVPKTNSLHPLALNWLIDDLSKRGTRQDAQQRKKTFEELENSLEAKFYDGGANRITEYFKNTRR